jgi:YesN/AraC family two-component response regulator
MMEGKDPHAILLVEDEESAGEIIMSMLEMRFPQTRIVSAGDGIAGLEAFQRILPELVITDLNMPEMDGLQMIRAIQAIQPDTRFIVVTAHSDQNYLAEVLSTGARVEVIAKPINLSALIAAITVRP